jgi:hypothetical protein
MEVPVIVVVRRMDLYGGAGNRRDAHAGNRRVIRVIQLFSVTRRTYR